MGDGPKKVDIRQLGISAELQEKLYKAEDSLAQVRGEKKDGFLDTCEIDQNKDGFLDITGAWRSFTTDEYLQIQSRFFDAGLIKKLRGPDVIDSVLSGLSHLGSIPLIDGLIDDIQSKDHSLMGCQNIVLGVLPYLFNDEEVDSTQLDSGELVLSIRGKLLGKDGYSGVGCYQESLQLLINRQIRTILIGQRLSSQKIEYFFEQWVGRMDDLSLRMIFPALISMGIVSVEDSVQSLSWFESVAGNADGLSQLISFMKHAGINSEAAKTIIRFVPNIHYNELSYAIEEMRRLGFSGDEIGNILLNLFDQTEVNERRKLLWHGNDYYTHLRWKHAFLNLSFFLETGLSPDLAVHYDVLSLDYFSTLSDLSESNDPFPVMKELYAELIISGIDDLSIFESILKKAFEARDKSAEILKTVVGLIGLMNTQGYSPAEIKLIVKMILPYILDSNSQNNIFLSALEQFPNHVWRETSDVVSFFQDSLDITGDSFGFFIIIMPDFFSVDLVKDRQIILDFLSVAMIFKDINLERAAISIIPKALKAGLTNPRDFQRLIELALQTAPKAKYEAMHSIPALFEAGFDSPEMIAKILGIIVGLNPKGYSFDIKYLPNALSALKEAGYDREAIAQYIEYICTNLSGYAGPVFKNLKALLGAGIKKPSDVVRLYKSIILSSNRKKLDSWDGDRHVIVSNLSTVMDKVRLEGDVTFELVESNLAGFVARYYGEDLSSLNELIEMFSIPFIEWNMKSFPTALARGFVRYLAEQKDRDTQFPNYILSKMLKFINVSYDIEMRLDSQDTIRKRFLEELERLLGLPKEKILILLKCNVTSIWKYFALDHAEGRDMTQFSPDEIDVYSRVASHLQSLSRNMIILSDLISFQDYSCRVKSEGADIVELSRIYGFLAAKVGQDIAQKFLQEVVVGYSFRRSDHMIGLERWYNLATDRIDVTQHNIREINAILNIVIAIAEAVEKRGVGLDIGLSDYLNDIFIDYIPQGSMTADIMWFAGRFDIEEINIAQLSGLDALADYMDLMDKLQAIGAESSARYMENNLVYADPIKLFKSLNGKLTGYMLDLRSVERTRVSANGRRRLLGDKLIDSLGTAYLDGHPISIETLPELLKFAREWNNAKKYIPRDFVDLYRQFSFYAYGMIAEFIKEETGDWLDIDKKDRFVMVLSEIGIDLDKLADELEKIGFTVRRKSDLEKGMNRLFTAPAYVFRRAYQKTIGPDSVGFRASELRVRPVRDWAQRSGVRVEAVYHRKKELARVIKCDRSKAGALILAKLSGLVDTQETMKELGSRFIFSAPLNMTAPDTPTMTEPAYKDGIQMNWATTQNGKDALLIIGRDGNPRIFDKRKLAIGDLLSVEDLQNKRLRSAIIDWKRKRKLKEISDEELFKMSIRPFHVISDKILFREIMRMKKYSLLCGMLLLDKKSGEIHKFKDDTASRRLYVEFEDGSFGIVDSSEYLSTGDVVEAALAAGAVKAVYMDTGMWDMATYQDGEGLKHRLDPGGSNSDRSTNRVVIFSRKP